MSDKTHYTVFIHTSERCFQWDFTAWGTLEDAVAGAPVDRVIAEEPDAVAVEYRRVTTETVEIVPIK